MVLVAQSKLFSTNNSAYKYSINICRDDSSDKDGVVSEKSKYYLRIYLTRVKKGVRKQTKWRLDIKLNGTSIATKDTFMWPETTLTMNANTPCLFYSTYVELDNNNTRYNLDARIECVNAEPKSGTVLFSFNTVQPDVIPDMPSNPFLDINQADKIILTWQEAKDAEGYFVELYRKRWKGDKYICIIQERAEGITKNEVITEDGVITYVNKAYALSELNFIPGDTFYFTVASISKTNTYSDPVRLSPGRTKGNIARTKKESKAWDYALTHVKRTGTFKKVARVWLKIDGVWKPAAD